MAAASFESRFDFVPFSLPLPLLLGRGAVDGGPTVPSPVRTPRAGPVGAGRTGGAWATRLARNAARSSFAAALGGSGATGAGMGTAAGGWYAGIACRFFGIAMGGTEKLGVGRGGGGGGRGGRGGAAGGIICGGMACGGMACWGIGGCGGDAGEAGGGGAREGRGGGGGPPGGGAGGGAPPWERAGGGGGGGGGAAPPPRPRGRARR